MSPLRRTTIAGTHRLDDSARHRRGSHRRARPGRRRGAALAVTVALIGCAVGIGAVGIGGGLVDLPATSTPEGAVDSTPATALASVRAGDSEPTTIAADSAYLRLAPTVPQAGTGDFVTVPPAPDRLTEEGELTYTVEVEVGLALDGSVVARTIDRVLDDERGWSSVGRSFHQVDSAGELRILVATPDTTDELCAPLQTNGEVSCRNGDLVVLNARRWVFGTEDYAGAVPAYRAYLVNHEVGHAIGYRHTACPGPGEPAPVMQQQTYGLDGCVRNSWLSAG